MAKLYEGLTANDVWIAALNDVMLQPIQEGRFQPTRELLHVTFHIEDSRQRYVLHRPINPAFALAEVIWIMSGSDKLQDIEWWNPRMREYSDDGKTLHGAYGSRLRKLDMAYYGNVDQLFHAYMALSVNPTRRDVILQIWDAERDLPDSAEPRAKDIPCNVVSHLLIRDGKLEWLQVMRSNDLMWGTPYNFIQFMTMQEIMAGWLGVEVGSYVHVSSSLHVYQHHWEHARNILKDGVKVGQDMEDLEIVDSLRVDYGRHEKLQKSLIHVMVNHLPRYTSDNVGELKYYVDDYEDNYPDVYKNWLRILVAETMRKLGDIDQARFTAQHCTDEVLRFSWLQWLNHKLQENENDQQ